ncbi:MAG: hypothetical protein ABSA77_06170 [Thermoguttaceae bacterium]
MNCGKDEGSDIGEAVSTTSSCDAFLFSDGDVSEVDGVEDLDDTESVASSSRMEDSETSLSIAAEGSACIAAEGSGLSAVTALER